MFCPSSFGLRSYNFVVPLTLESSRIKRFICSRLGAIETSVCLRVRARLNFDLSTTVPSVTLSQPRCGL